MGGNVRKRRFLGIAVGAAVVGAVWAASLAPVASAVDTHLEVFDPEGPYERLIDVGKPGFSAGDEIVEIHRLLDPADASVVGRDFGQIKVVKVLAGGEDFVFVLAATARLEGGDIVVQGAGRFGQISSPGGLTLAVTGGTGTYELARGTVTITPAEVGGMEGVLLAFDLTTTN